jgi:YidC/Oxa1 family membrane protein insertase
MSLRLQSASGSTVRRLILALVLISVILLASGCGVPQGDIDPTVPPKGPWEVVVVFPLTESIVFLNQVIKNAGIPYSYGFAIILLTLIIKAVTLPLTMMQLRSMKATQELQPKLQELQRKFGKDRERLAQAQMEMYKEAGVNPLGGCLPLLIQMPILFGLYAALYRLAGLKLLTGQQFLFIPDLSFPTPTSGIDWIMRYFNEGQYGTLVAYFILPVIFLISQIVMQKMSQTTPPSGDPQQALTGQMMTFMPIMFAYFTLTLPSGLSLYWVTSNVLQIVQQYFVTGWGGLKPASATTDRKQVSAARADKGGGDDEVGYEDLSEPADQPADATPKSSRRSRRRRK